jgi:hypothetical protein
MTRPILDHAVLGNRCWAWAAGCWREWSNTHADWLPSDPPPAEATHSNYRTLILNRQS